MSALEATLDERGSRYGDFGDHAIIAQDIQNAMRKTAGWQKLSPVHAQALTVIADKIARILNGDPNYDDNWHDIQGYAKLVEDRLPKKPAPPAQVDNCGSISAVLQHELDVLAPDAWKVISVQVMPLNAGFRRISASISHDDGLIDNMVKMTLQSVHEGARYMDIVFDLIEDAKRQYPEGPWCSV